MRITTRKWKKKQREREGEREVGGKKISSTYPLPLFYSHAIFESSF